MDLELSYLEDFLREEFSRYRGVRIRVVAPSGTARSVDLEQNYDEETGTVHKRSGVVLRTEKNEWFFPREWGQPGNRTQIYREVERIREILDQQSR